MRARRREAAAKQGAARGRSSYDSSAVRDTYSVDQAQFSVHARVVLGILAFVMVLVLGKLLWLQVVKAQEYSTLAAARRTNVIMLHAKRGTIYDRNGNILAISKDCKTIYANPKEIENAQVIADILAEVLGGDAESYVSKLTQDTTFIYLSRQVDEDKADELKSRLDQEKIKGIYYLEDTKRYYPYGNIASQVLGIVGVDGDGLTGLELYYNDILKGSDGQMILETGGKGTPIAGGNATVTEAQNGTDIVISLDINTQQVAEQTIKKGTADYKADSGSVVVTEPRTGEILAICSTPLFDVTDTSQIEEGATALKPVSTAYEPGSIFKILTAAIALDTQSITKDQVFSVPAQVKVGDDMVSDDDGRSTTMDMTLEEMLRRSSNAGLALVAQNYIGATAFSEGLSKFGIGALTGIDYPGETQGLVKELSQYDGASVGAMSFGQALSFPMIQMVKATSALANGGVMTTPHLLVTKNGEQVSWQTSDPVISADTASTITKYLQTVVESGTAQQAQVAGYDVAGKTGTAEQAGEDGYASGKLVSSLIGYAPAQDPQVLVYVGVNGTEYHGGSSAAPLFATIMQEALSDLGVAPTK